MKTFIYINFLLLSGNELDVDFERECRSRGINENDELEIIPVHSITGHSAYIVCVVNQ